MDSSSVGMVMETWSTIGDSKQQSLVGGFNPSETYESINPSQINIEGKKKKTENHQLVVL